LYVSAFLGLSMPEDIITGWLYRMGPYLLRQSQHREVLIRKWRLELQKLERICLQLSQSETPESRGKEAALREEMKQIEEVLACLPTDKP
jgi:tRNA (adenine22-N1)-methyltransferase